jgi:hypothetical protein
MSEAWKVDSAKMRDLYIKQVFEWVEQHKYVTFPKPRFGADRSLDQSALFHVWLTEIAAFLTPCHKKEVTDGMLEGTKKTMKGLFYRNTKYEWMLHKVECPISKRSKIDYTSSKSWSRGQMFEVLNFMQDWAASEIGLILESRGEHAKLSREQKV